ncbi:MAG TPA: hypothetical protein VEX37_05270 [Thermomicrobiales bacterium]|nr:hypothetical protein [Thermomicrobiales bacterium]
MATVENSADGQSRYGRLEARLELIAVILLGLAATATAWAAFQGGQYDGQMLTAFTEANLNLTDANAYYSEGTQTYIEDELIFLRYVEATVEGDDELAIYMRESLMSDQLVAAIEWWETEGTEFDSPFVEENPNYVIDSYVLADELAAATDEAFEAGEEANKTGDTYNLITVLLAAALFVLGIATSFKVLPVRMGLIGIGVFIFVGSTAWMLTLPVAS